MEVTDLTCRSSDYNPPGSGGGGGYVNPEPDLNATQNAQQTATANAQTATAQAQATLTAGAGLSSSDKTATARANKTATANAKKTETANAQATATWLAQHRPDGYYMGKSNTDCATTCNAKRCFSEAPFYFCGLSKPSSCLDKMPGTNTDFTGMLCDGTTVEIAPGTLAGDSSSTDYSGALLASNNFEYKLFRKYSTYKKWPPCFSRSAYIAEYSDLTSNGGFSLTFSATIVCGSSDNAQFPSSWSSHFVDGALCSTGADVNQAANTCSLCSSGSWVRNYDYGGYYCRGSTPTTCSNDYPGLYCDSRFGGGMGTASVYANFCYSKQIADGTRYCATPAP